MAYDGEYFYFTLKNRKDILKLDNTLKPVCLFQCSRIYTHICYDSTDRCFWAAISSKADTIYKLDICMNETDRLHISNSSPYITGLAYNSCANVIIVSGCRGIISVGKNSCCNHIPIDCECVKCVCTLSDYIIVYKSCRNVIIYDRCGILKYKLCVPDEYCILSIIALPLCPCPKFYILAYKKGCYPYIAEWYTTECELNISCHPCCDNHDNCNNSGNIVNSIALIENSISDILTAESEKIKKIISVTDNVEDILKLNEAVNRTIQNITHLEIILHDKLVLCGKCDK
jgi:hypothetical protein